MFVGQGHELAENSVLVRIESLDDFAVCSNVLIADVFETIGVGILPHEMGDQVDALKVNGEEIRLEFFVCVKADVFERFGGGQCDLKKVFRVVRQRRRLICEVPILKVGALPCCRICQL